MNKKLQTLWSTKNKNDEWWSSFVTSPLAIMANYIVVDFKWLTPDRITLASFVVALVAAIFIIAGGTTNFIIAAILIHLSHVLDCMDGQMARYRKTSSPVGSYADRLTDQVQVIVWFGAVSYAAYAQSSSSILAVVLAFTGISFYSLRGYAKYVAIHIEMSQDPEYLTKMAAIDAVPETAGLAFSISANAKWLLAQQHKILRFDEGVFIFMLSLALVLNELMPMLWVFAVSQLFIGLFRAVQHGRNIEAKHKTEIQK